MRYFLFLLTLVLLTACNLDPKIDASSEANLQKSIQKIMKSLPQEEQAQFEESIRLIMFSNVESLSDMVAMGQNTEVMMGGFMAKVDGKSAKEIIQMGNDVRKKRGERDVSISSSPSLSQIEQEAKSKTTSELIEKTVSMKLKSKKKKPTDYDEYIELVFIISNNGDKDIKGIKGVTEYRDMFGDIITSVIVSYDEGIKAGETKEYITGIDFNRFDEKDIRLVTAKTEDIKFSFIPKTIIFQDGTEISVE
jgi:hypothetical protein